MTALLAVLCLQSAQPILITEDSFNSLRDRLAARPSEMEWRRIDWKPGLATGLRDANQLDRPLMLWITEGDPLGTTDREGILARQSVWKSTKIQELSKFFVACTERIDTLRQNDNPEITKVIDAIGLSSLRPGVYFVTASGISLGSTQVLDENVVRSVMEPALSRYGKLEGRLVAGSSSKPVGGVGPPPNGLILRVVSRDLDSTQRNDVLQHSWNLDYAWFTREESLQWIPLEDRARAERVMPVELVRRFARLHLLDSVRGLPRSFNESDIQNSTLRAEVASVIVRSGVRTLVVRYSGNVLMSQAGEWGLSPTDSPTKQNRGIDLQLYGRATIAWPTRAFTSFEMIAAGTRWGGVEKNDRKQNLGPAPIGFYCSLAANLPAERVPPLFFDQYSW